LIVVGRDPNDQYMPIAFVVVETKTKETWRWFLNLLFEDIGSVETNKWVFISDQQKVKKLYSWIVLLFCKFFFSLFL